MSVSNTAAALTPAIFQRNGSRDARAPSDEVRKVLRCSARFSAASYHLRLPEGDEDAVRTVTLDEVRGSLDWSLAIGPMVGAVSSRYVDVTQLTTVRDACSTHRAH